MIPRMVAFLARLFPERAREGVIELPYEKHRAELASGDVLLWSGRGFVSRAIMWRTESPFSHASLVDLDRGRVWLFESREGRGVQHVPLSSVIGRYGRVAWFQHVLPEGSSGGAILPPVDREEATLWAIERVGDPYDYGAIARIVRAMAPWRPPIGWKDGEPLPRRAICSAFVAGAIRAAGRDLVPFRTDALTTPGDLGRSGLLRYVGDLVP